MQSALPLLAVHLADEIIEVEIATCLYRRAEDYSQFGVGRCPASHEVGEDQTFSADVVASG